MQQLIQTLPKAELHMHIEGSLEPELMFHLAQRNQIALPYQSVDDVKKAYQFTNLQSFLDIYYAACQVLVHEQDFFDLMYAYLKRAHDDRVVHAEIFFDPQTHTQRGVDFSVFMRGFQQAQLIAEREFGITSHLILCFLRDLGATAAMKTLDQALAFRDFFVGVGLDSAEVGHPPSNFKDVYAKAQANDLYTVAHAGEEGPPEYMWQAIEMLSVARIDHGVRCIEDEKLMDYLYDHQLPLTVCPLSNVSLKVYPDLAQHPLKKILEHGICVTLNSDDPVYFGGYVNDVFLQTAASLDLTEKQVITLAKNSINASFLTQERKQQFINRIDSVSHA